MHGHAGEVGADLGPFAGMRVALGALVLEDQLAGGGVALSFGQRQQLVEHFLPVGIGQAAAALRAGGAARLAICRSGWLARACF